MSKDERISRFKTSRVSRVLLKFMNKICGMDEEMPLFIEENWGTKASQRVADFVEQNHEWLGCFCATKAMGSKENSCGEQRVAWSSCK